MSSPLALEALTAQALQSVRYVLTDFDDTLTLDGQLPTPTLAALYRLQAAGVGVIPVTGGCAGWSDMMARVLPVSGVISEGGGVFLQPENGCVEYEFFVAEELMRARQAELLTLLEPLLERFAPLKLSRDQAYRLTDVAIDYGQEIRPPATAQCQALLHELTELGLNAKVSSIHINVCQAGVDKYAMAAKVLAQRLAIAPDHMAQQVLYVGDAPNDETMFAKFPLSVGVANITQHLAHMQHLPRYITAQAGGLGFAELADKLLLAQTKKAL
ncbi:HAD-IIB family hydrolase [Marinomonas ostreistagni]|uniref:HAD-IIB family hydrolase n=1 Tax=Marinomonas ostreistagni TaxID=359209 RepID=UPI00194E8246|nr:HAD-IIB family hydrolase [Marinomonas ostreistagni]MBM6550932.1 HAD family phosphatase [Marinomonas ostreistagni]